ncbi:MAG: trimethylamine corrinoid protein 2 [Eubacteriales bacterium]|nr:trimethylamine corrinoid protein 2 [Eubacteriales bacterium]
MNERYRANWQKLYDEFEAWWQAKNPSPMLWATAKRKAPLAAAEAETPFADEKDFYVNTRELSLRYRNFCREHEFLGQAFPNFSLNLGAGSLALYLGSEPNFHWDTVWFSETVKNGWQGVPDFSFDEKNPWWQLHLDLYRQAVELAGDDYLVAIPDIVENIDIVAALRGPQDTCFDLMDEPEEIERRVRQIDGLYFQYYEPFFQMVRRPEGVSSYTAFNILGQGRVAKIQCDFAALMSPAQFRRFTQPSLAAQCAVLDHAIYHLDGPDAIRHVDALMEIDRLAGIQWTSGAGNPDGLDARWYEPIFDKVRGAGKNLLIYAMDGDLDQKMAGIDRLVERYGKSGFYVQFPDVLSYDEGQHLLEHADQYWKE